MKAREVMTPNVVSVRPDMPVREIARLLLDGRISAVPVIDDGGVPIGMVSEGDLIGRNETDREARRDWWLALLAEGEPLHPDFLAALHAPDRKARDVMSAPLVTVGEETDIDEIVRLLSAYHIKRVPVLRQGRVVGIVSRADLLRALIEACPPAPAAAPRTGLLAGALARIDEQFVHRHATQPRSAEPASEPLTEGLRAADFQNLAVDFENKELHHREEQRRHAAQERLRKVRGLIEQHISDDEWRAVLHQARSAAEHGQKEFMLLRFPSELCSDGGRAINVTEPDWPATLRGEAAETYLRWERDLKPCGFHLAARTLDFPGGVPGDIGMFLIWGEGPQV